MDVPMDVAIGYFSQIKNGLHAIINRLHAIINCLHAIINLSFQIALPLTLSLPQTILGHCLVRSVFLYSHPVVVPFESSRLCNHDCMLILPLAPQPRQIKLVSLGRYVQ